MLTSHHRLKQEGMKLLEVACQRVSRFSFEADVNVLLFRELGESP